MSVQRGKRATQNLFLFKRGLVFSFLPPFVRSQNNSAIERLYYNVEPGSLTVVLGIFSISLIGFGIVGMLRSIVVYPAGKSLLSRTSGVRFETEIDIPISHSCTIYDLTEMVYWSTLPVVSLYQNLHFQEKGNNKKMRVFGYFFSGMSVYEVIASYIFPTLNGISIPCLASIGSPNSTRMVIKNIFGGVSQRIETGTHSQENLTYKYLVFLLSQASSNEGLGLLNFSLDWQYITSAYTSFPLKQQVNSWIGLAIAYVACIGLYYNNVWGAKDLPILSSSLFNSTGHKFNQSAIFTPGTQVLNIDALKVTGTPRLTATLIWSYGFANAAIGALIVHTLIYYSKE